MGDSMDEMIPAVMNWLPTDQVGRPCPWLAIAHGGSQQLEAFYSVSKNQCYTRKVPELDDKFVCDVGGGDGWLILDEIHKNFLLFNIVTMEKVCLPSSVGISLIRDGACCLISSAPTTSECRVLIYDCAQQIVISCNVGDDRFIMRRTIVVCKSTEFFPRVDGGVIMAAGKIYALSSIDNTLLVCEKIEEPHRFTEIISRFEALQIRGLCRLLESCGEILLVSKEGFGYSKHEITRFKVFRADLMRRKWFRMKNIGKRAIFHEQNQCLSCLTDGLKDVKENCIYFTETGDRNMFVFDLADSSVTMHLPYSNVSPNDSRLSWFMVPYSHME